MLYQSRLRVGLFCGILGAIAFSGKAIIIKLAYQYPVDAITLLMLRMLLATPVFMLIAWWVGRGQARLSARDWRAIVLLGFVGYYLSSYLDFAGLQYISAGLERLILYLNPTLVLVLGWLFLGKRIHRWQVLAMCISYLGIAIVFADALDLAKPMVALLTGSALVLLSALSYAVYLLYSAQVVQRVGSVRLACLATSVAGLMCVIQFALMRPWTLVWQLPSVVIELSVLNAMACTVLPVILVMIAVECVGAAIASQLGMVGPIATLAMGVLILHEPLTMAITLGTLLVLGGVWLVTKFGANQT